MTNSSSDSRAKSGSSIPPDDLRRSLVAARSNGQNLPHIGLVGDTYAILLAGKDTAGRFCLTKTPRRTERRAGQTSLLLPVAGEGFLLTLPFIERRNQTTEIGQEPLFRFGDYTGTER